MNSVVHIPIWVPSAEQTLSPALGHEAGEPVGAEEGCTAGLDEAAAGAEGAAEGAAAGELGAAEEGAAAGALGAAEGVEAAGDGEGCTADGALDCAVELTLWPSGTVTALGIVQSTGVHSSPCTLPSPVGAIVLNRLIVTSMLPHAQPAQVF